MTTGLSLFRKAFDSPLRAFERSFCLCSCVLLHLAELRLQFPLLTVLLSRRLSTEVAGNGDDVRRVDIDYARGVSVFLVLDDRRRRCATGHR